MTVTTDQRRLAPLLEPGRIGGLTVRNRIVMCPMGDNLAQPDGTVSERQRAYLEARARGGAGLLLIGSVAVAYPAGSFSATQTAASRDEHVAGLRALADAVHGHGAAIAAQLVHDGPQSLHDIEQGRPVLLPSPPAPYRSDALSAMVTPEESARMAAPFTQPTSRYAPHVATDDDLEQVIAQFAAAARRCVDAGFDGIELHAGHGYLIDAFRSPYTNRRDDRWGGPLEHRARLLFEVVAAVRAAIGAVPLWCRLNALEHFRDPGETLAETLELAPRLEAAGLDALHVSAYSDPGTAIGVTEAHTPSTPGALIEHARAVKAVLSIPMITFGKLEPYAAADAIVGGAADFVAMGRKLLADPDLPNKLAAGRLDDVRPCIYQYRCIGNIFVRDAIACVANPDTAHEHEHDAEVEVAVAVARHRLGREPAVAPMRVGVVGGGPAGIETAVRLARTGHAVTLHEQAPVLGGLLTLAGRADPHLDRFLGWLRHSIGQTDVDVRLGAAVTADVIAAAGYDRVVVATGAPSPTPAVPLAPHALPMRTLRALAAHDELEGHRVVIVGGGKAGCSLAAMYRARGHAVTVIEPSGVFAVQLGLPGRFRLVHDLQTAGVDLVAAPVTRVGDGGVECGAASDGTRRTIPADVVVVTETEPAEPPLAAALRALGIDPEVIGDARGPFGLEGALADAARVATLDSPSTATSAG